jgi:hypothetical protein
MEDLLGAPEHSSIALKLAKATSEGRRLSHAEIVEKKVRMKEERRWSRYGPIGDLQGVHLRKVSQEKGMRNRAESLYSPLPQYRGEERCDREGVCLQDLIRLKYRDFLAAIASQFKF